MVNAKKSISLAVGAIIAMASSGVALAGRADSISTVYFDSYGTMVGQQMGFCDGSPNYEARGNIHTAFHVTTSGPCTFCSGPGQPGGPGGRGPCPKPNYIDPPKTVVNYTLPAAVTLDEACSEMQNCDSPQPEPVPGYYSWPVTH